MARVDIANANNMNGDYRGKGTWYESNGDTGNYVIDQTNTLIEDGIQIRQKHDPDDGPAAELLLELKEIVPYIYSLTVNGNAMGNGFIMGDVLRFYMNNIKQESVTEVGYQLLAPGRIRVFGSCTGNTAGNYIMWHEELERVDEDG